MPGNDLGLAIILLTIIIKTALLPLSKQSIKSQKSLQDLQPKIDEVKKKYADNKEEQGKAMLGLYKENKVNPFSSCLPLIIQLPFLLAVYRVFRVGFENGALEKVYPFITRPDIINNIAFGFLDLSKPNIILALLAGAAQFWQAKMMMTSKAAIKTPGAKDENMMAMMNKQMVYFMPAITVFIGLTLPGGLSLYWFITTLLTALQQKYIFGRKDKKDDSNQDSLNSGGDNVVEGEIVK
jgi:YidC/Oxa1 family membrane protein insertase